MLKLEECKKTLQAEGKKYTDEEVKKLREELYRMASIVNDTKAIRDENIKR